MARLMHSSLESIACEMLVCYDPRNSYTTLQPLSHSTGACLNPTPQSQAAVGSEHHCYGMFEIPHLLQRHFARSIITSKAQCHALDRKTTGL